MCVYIKLLCLNWLTNLSAVNMQLPMLHIEISKKMLNYTFLEV